MDSYTCYIFPFLLLFLVLHSFHSTSLALEYDVLTYGAIADGTSDSTNAFNTAWVQACASSKPSTLSVPKGNFLIRNVLFKGPCASNALAFRIDGTLLAPSDYNVIGKSKNWVMFRNINGLTVSGGTLDGQGTSLWACKASKKKCPTGAMSLAISNSQNIEVNGLTLVNSQMFHMTINGCQNVKIVGVTVSAPENSSNTDGIHVSSSTGVTIMNAKIATGDDCISIGPGTSNLWIEGVMCGPGHGISIGSLGQTVKEEGVQNVTVANAQFSGTYNGVRIKTWGKPSNGFAKNILFQNCTMSNVKNPIFIDQHYCPNKKKCDGQESGIRISDVTYNDIHGSSATEVAVNLDCSKRYPCTGIIMEDVKLTFKNQAALATCANADVSTSGFVQPSTSCF